MKNIPINDLKKLAKDNDLTHVIIFALDNERKLHHVATFGTTNDYSEQSASFGNRLKLMLGWPESLLAMPLKISRIIAENRRLRRKLKELKCLKHR